MMTTQLLAFVMDHPVSALSAFGLVTMPLNVLWAYAFVGCLRDARRGTSATDGGLGEEAPLDPASWMLLLFLTGWFGAAAYLLVTRLPQGALRRMLSPAT